MEENNEANVTVSILVKSRNKVEGKHPYIYFFYIKKGWEQCCFCHIYQGIGLHQFGKKKCYRKK